MKRLIPTVSRRSRGVNSAAAEESVKAYPGRSATVGNCRRYARVLKKSKTAEVSRRRSTLKKKKEEGLNFLTKEATGK